MCGGGHMKGEKNQKGGVKCGKRNREHLGHLKAFSLELGLMGAERSEIWTGLNSEAAAGGECSSRCTNKTPVR